MSDIHSIEAEQRQLIAAYEQAEKDYVLARELGRFDLMRKCADRMEWLRYSMGRKETQEALLDELDMWRRVA